VESRSTIRSAIHYAIYIIYPIFADEDTANQAVSNTAAAVALLSLNIDGMCSDSDAAVPSPRSVPEDHCDASDDILRHDSDKEVEPQVGEPKLDTAFNVLIAESAQDVSKEVEAPGSNTVDILSPEPATDVPEIKEPNKNTATEGSVKEVAEKEKEAKAALSCGECGRVCANKSGLMSHKRKHRKSQT
jgi:hypothetical protein